MRQWASWLVIGTLAVSVLAGCKVVSDTVSGLKAPTAAGEETPMQQGRREAEPLTAIPIYGQAIAWAAGILFGLYHANRKGAENRLKVQGVSATPITGHLGNSVAVFGLSLEDVVQCIANVSHYVFERGTDGSVQKRTWKTVIAGLLAWAVTQLPAINAWAAGNSTKFGAALLTITGLIMGLEKAVSIIKPVQTASTTLAPATA